MWNFKTNELDLSEKLLIEMFMYDMGSLIIKMNNKCVTIKYPSLILQRQIYVYKTVVIVIFCVEIHNSLSS